MPRQPRSIFPNTAYHIQNSGAIGATIFRKKSDYAAFEKTLAEVTTRYPIPILAYVLLPDRFELVLHPKSGQDEYLSDFMKWLQATHTQRWHVANRLAGTGRLYQGRFKAFPIQSDAASNFQYIRTVIRAVESLPRRHKLVRRAQDWEPGSLFRRLHPDHDQLRNFLAPWPEGAFPGDSRWLERVKTPLQPAEEAALQPSMKRGRPFGSAEWVLKAAKKMNLEHTIRAHGRPRKNAKIKL